jgi:maltose O-acetyltransferase
MMPEKPYPRWQRILSEEMGGLSFRRGLLSMVERLWPVGFGGRLRAQLYRCFGCSIGRGTIFMGPIGFGVGSRLENFRMGERCFINVSVFVDAAAPVILGDGVSIGHHVVIITTDHELGPSEHRAEAVCPRPVTICTGAWIAAGVTLLPGVTIGQGAVVAAGAVVTKDVPPDTLVGGIPAKFIRRIESPLVTTL